MILLQRKLVALLDKHNSKNEVGFTRQKFVDYIVEQKKWPRINYLFYRKDAFRRKIDAVLGDCIRGSKKEDYEYIDEDDDGKTLLVTRRGRDFTEIPLGCFEEFLKRRKRTSNFLFSTNFIFGSIFGATIFALVSWLLEKMR